MKGEERQEKMKGKVTAVHGHVVEIEFKEGSPALNGPIIEINVCESVIILD